MEAAVMFSTQIAVLKDPDFQEVQQGRASHHECEDAENKHGADRSHEKSECRKAADDQNRRNRGQHQPEAWDRIPKMAAFSNQIDRGLSGKDQGGKDQCLQTWHVEMEYISS